MVETVLRVWQQVIERFARITRVDISYLVSGGFWGLAAQVSVSVCGLLLSVILSRFLSPATYGEYKYIIAAVGFLATFSLVGVSLATMQSTARGYDRSLTDGFRMSLRWSPLIYIGAFVVSLYYWYMGNTTLAIGILIGGCTTPLLTAANLYSSFLTGKSDFARQAIYTGGIAAPLSTLALIVSVLTIGTPVAVATTYFIVNTLVAYALYRSTMHAYASQTAASDPEMFTYAKHMSWMGIMIGIAGNADALLVFHFLGATDLAMYAFAIGILDQTRGPLKTLDNMLRVRFVRHPTNVIQSNIGNKHLWLLLSSIAAIVVYIPLAPFVYSVLFPAYIAAVPYSQVYALSLLSIVFTPAGSYLFAKKQLNKQYMGTIVSSVIQIASAFIGIIFWGLWGLIIARVTTRIMTGYINYIFYRFSTHETM